MRIAHLNGCPQHLPTIAEWQHTEFSYLNPSVTIAQRQERLQASLQGSGLPLTLVALAEDGHPVGAASILPKTITHAHLTPWLSTVVVPEAFRGQGIASQLSLRAAQEAQRLGFKDLYLFTPRNASLYRRLGWASIETSDLHGMEITIMGRPTTT